MTKVSPSPKQKEILEMLARGYIYKEIEAEIGFSERTMKSHIKLLMAKMNVGNRVAVVVKALQLGYIDFPKEDEYR